MTKKSFLVVLMAAFLGLAPVHAYEFPGFEWSVGADMTTAYLYRGMKYGGLAFQPDVMLGYGGLNLEGWFNLSHETSAFTKGEFAPEVDVTLSYSISCVEVGVTQFCYFDGNKFFNFKGSSYEAYQNGTQNTTQTEVFARLNLGAVTDKVPLRIGWYTYVAGDDRYADTDHPIVNGTDTTFAMKQAYSSYIEIAYDIALPLNFTLTPTVGMTPWKSLYTDYEGNFAVNNISLKLNWEWEVGDHCCLDLYAIGMLNTYGINKTNLVPPIKDSYCTQRLNGALGLGIWFY